MWIGGLALNENRLANIVLAGFMGVGKSTVGRMLADRLRWQFVDTDEEIVARVGMSIPEIFESQGEVGFRRYEDIVCQSVALRDAHVIATGGGMVINPNNRALLSSTGLLVYLHADVEAIRKRLGEIAKSGRPLAWGWEDRYEARLPIYETLPYRVDTTNLTPYQVTDRLIELWKHTYK